MRHVSTKWASVAVILIGALASACITHPVVYPHDWAKQVIVEGDSCPVINGEYQNAGEQFACLGCPAFRNTVSLAQLLNRWNDAEARKADNHLGETFAELAEDAFQTVSLRLVEGKLHIEASLADGSTRTFDLPTRQRCADSMVLLLKGDWGHESDSEVAVVLRRTLALGRAEDGSLLVRESSLSVSYLFVVPVEAETSADWTRFPPVAPAPE